VPFRNFYKEEKEKQSIQCEEVVEGALNIISSSLINKKITLKSDFQCHKTIHVLANEMRQVILNLIKNAEDILIEKEIDSPTIWVRTYHDKSCAYLEVSDNAGGIPEKIKEKIFEPYFSTKPKKEGTGLGLYMSKLIIEDHCHRKLYVKNGKEGACFTIQITFI